MAFRKSPPNLPVRTNSRNDGYRMSVVGLLIVSVVAPLFILATRTGNFHTSGATLFSLDMLVVGVSFRRKHFLVGYFLCA